MIGFVVYGNKLIFLWGNEYFWSNVILFNLFEEIFRSVKVENWKI